MTINTGSSSQLRVSSLGWTGDKITSLKDNQVFVFGVNDKGKHTGGNAEAALAFGAEEGKTSGFHGVNKSAYGIQTTKWSNDGNKSEPRERIIHEIAQLYNDAKANVDKEFLVGYTDNNGNVDYKNNSGYSAKELAGMFAAAGDIVGGIPPNIIFHNKFKDMVNNPGNTVLANHETTNTANVAQNTAQQVANVLEERPARVQPTTISNPDLWADIKAHPLFAPWRDPESMEFPEGKAKTPKEKPSKTEAHEGGKASAEKSDKNEKKNDADKNEKKPESVDKNTSEKPKDKKPDEDKPKKKNWFSRTFSNPNISYNPLSRGWYWGKSAIKGAIAVPTRIVAKAAHIVGRPQQLFEGEARSDVFKNTGRGITNLFRGVTGAIYKPHRESLKYENVFKDYGSGRGVGQTTNQAKLFTRGFSKFMPAIFPYPVPIKFASHMLQGVSHFVADTVSGKTNYEHTSHAFKKAFGWNYTIK